MFFLIPIPSSGAVASGSVGMAVVGKVDIVVIEWPLEDDDWYV